MRTLTRDLPDGSLEIDYTAMRERDEAMADQRREERLDREFDAERVNAALRKLAELQEFEVSAVTFPWGKK